MTTTQNTASGCIPFPAGAVRVGAWCDTNSAEPFRYVEGARHHIERGDRTIVVYVDGMQRGDGSVECGVTVHELHADDPITAAQARQIAQALINAADACERWTED